MKAALRATLWALGAGLSSFALACGETEEERGSLMLAISTDMYVDKDIGRVDIVVQPERGPLQSTQVNLFPELDGQFLPGTFAIVEGSEPGEFVRVRIIARQEQRVRVVREAALRVPRQRTALLSMPIQWLCDGQVRQEGQLHRSDCPEDFTCISGSCQPAEVDEATLPDYRLENVFGGGNASGGGECFDTVPCFEDSFEPELDLQNCVLDAPLAGDLNVGLVLPSGGDGHCTSSECWIPLDQSELTGWHAVDGGSAIQLPSAVCSHVSEGNASVRASTRCAPKAPGTPTCGPWTLVGSEPGGEFPDPVCPEGDNCEEPIDNVPQFEAALIEVLNVSAATVARSVLDACAELAGVSAPASPTPEDVNAICDQAKTSLGRDPLVWYQTPTSCRMDYAHQAQCESNCDESCAPLPVEERCQEGVVSGVCDGVCGSRRCLAAPSQSVPCAGSCSGHFRGICQGNCVGQCDGACSLTSPDGFCDGVCTGTCTGLCQGRAEGACQGLCDGDPNLAAEACAAGARCLGGCTGTYTDAAACDGALGSSGCLPGCEGLCGASARASQVCEPATAWVLPGSGVTAARAASIAETLPALVRARDVQIAALLDELGRLRDRLMTTPAAAAAQLSQVGTTIDGLNALQTICLDLLNSVGPARSSMGTVVSPPVTSCEPFSAEGGTPLIDDFEDGDGLVLPNEGRDGGGWYVVADTSGGVLDTTNPLIVSGGAQGSRHSLFLSGRGFSDWGAGVAVDLRQGSSMYDASIYQGFSFWARGVGTLYLKFHQANLTHGHPCATCPAGGADCGIFYKHQVTLSDTWTEHTVLWTELIRDYEGGTPFYPSELLKIDFHAPGPEIFEFQLDDVSFYRAL